MTVITFLGCGRLATSVLVGLLKADSKPAVPTHERLFEEYRACVRTMQSSKLVYDNISRANFSVRPARVLWDDNENVAAVANADVVVLGVSKEHSRTLLGAEPMAKALLGRLLISIVGGLSVEEISGCIKEVTGVQHADIVEAIPNVAAAACESVTIIRDQPPVSEESNMLVQKVFNAVGKCIYMPTNLMNVSAVLGGSASALAGLILEGLIDGGISKSLSKEHATIIAVQGIKEIITMMERGADIATLQEKASRPGGYTLDTLSTPDAKALKGEASRVVVEATERLGLPKSLDKGID